jgi:hypothetical protein
MRSVLLLFAVAGFAGARSLDAQDAQFQQIAWGSSAERSEQLIRALGYRFVERKPLGVVEYAGAGGERLSAVTTPNGLQGVARSWALRSEEEALHRFRHLQDSIARYMRRGPDTLQTRAATWASSTGTISVSSMENDEPGFPFRVFVSHRSSRFIEEFSAIVLRETLADQEAEQAWFRSRVDASRWVVLYWQRDLAVSYDRTRVSRPANGVIRLWLRWDQRTPQETTSFPRVSYLYSLEHTEVRCSPPSTRDSAMYFYDANGRIVRSADQDWSRWETTVPDSVGEAFVEAVCRTLRR